MGSNQCAWLCLAQEKGSLLLAKGAEEQQQLADRHAMLQQANVSAKLFDSHALQILEPALAVSPDMHGLLVASDAQMVRQLARCAEHGICLRQKQPCIEYNGTFVVPSCEQVCGAERQGSSQSAPTEMRLIQQLSVSGRRGRSIHAGAEWQGAWAAY